MGNLAITAEVLTKRYCLGERQIRHDTLRDQAMHRLMLRCWGCAYGSTEKI